MNSFKIGIAAILVTMLASSASIAQTPHRVLKSSIAKYDGSFDLAVTNYAKELADWHAHMAKVDEDKKNDVPKEKAYAPFPAPTAPPEVTASLDTSGKPNYIIVDDDPTADQVLAAKKAALTKRLWGAFDDAEKALVPERKDMAFTFRERDIRAADNVRRSKIVEAQRGILTAIGIGRKSPQQIDDEVANGRTADDTKFLQDQETRRQKIDAIQRAAARVMSDIDDLTIADVDAYTIAPLPN